MLSVPLFFSSFLLRDHPTPSTSATLHKRGDTVRDIEPSEVKVVSTRDSVLRPSLVVVLLEL
jgi:hypothetical protein